MLFVVTSGVVGASEVNDTCDSIVSQDSLNSDFSVDDLSLIDDVGSSDVGELEVSENSSDVGKFGVSDDSSDVGGSDVGELEVSDDSSDVGGSDVGELEVSDDSSDVGKLGVLRILLLGLIMEFLLFLN